MRRSKVPSELRQIGQNVKHRGFFSYSLRDRPVDFKHFNVIILYWKILWTFIDDKNGFNNDIFYIKCVTEICSKNKHIKYLLFGTQYIVLTSIYNCIDYAILISDCTSQKRSFYPLHRNSRWNVFVKNIIRPLVELYSGTKNKMYGRGQNERKRKSLNLYHLFQWIILNLTFSSTIVVDDNSYLIDGFVLKTVHTFYFS